MKKILILLTVLISSISLYSQEIERLDFNLSLRSNHFWRGITVTDGAMADVDINYALDHKKYLKLGVWGGIGLGDTNGQHYHEINYYLHYSTGKWGVGVWDVFNSTGRLKDAKDNDIWNYDHKTTGHRFDFRGYFVFCDSFPLKLDYGTSFYGADRNEKGDQRWSTYTGLNYPIIKGKVVDLDIFCGAAFGLAGKSSFYGNEKHDFDIVNAGITASKDVTVLGYKLPVSATAMWNPSRKEARVQIATSLF
ncbi:MULTISPECIES: hypothetical protein [Apibacter]|uniref:hypothetical protein n=1 Tax=Apibacter TaxID=1778601 RepID=UPI001C69B7AF|nr:MULTISPECIES: hypothetical protein [Apibacter]QYN49872.1 hypothetical protein GYM73_09790 [Apibacter sp. ESL0432]